MLWKIAKQGQVSTGHLTYVSSEIRGKQYLSSLMMGCCDKNIQIIAIEVSLVVNK